MRTHFWLPTSGVSVHFFVPELKLIRVLRRFMMVHLPWGEPIFPPFVKCLKSLPNLHTLEIGWLKNSTTTALQTAREGVKLPQIKTLIPPPAAYPLFQHCCGVEDVACVVEFYEGSSDGFFKSLASNRHSKIKQLMIPLVLQGDSSCE